MSETHYLDIASLISDAKRAKRPGYWPDEQAAREFANKFPATFLAIVKGVRAHDAHRIEALEAALGEALFALSWTEEGLRKLTDAVECLLEDSRHMTTPIRLSSVVQSRLQDGLRAANQPLPKRTGEVTEKGTSA